MKRSIVRLSKYAPPLAPGKLPVYDHALAFLAKDRQQKLAALVSDPPTSTLEREQREVDAWINDPETRFNARNGLADLSLPVYRHLAERTFRKEGTLAILNQRVSQMYLVPDLLPHIAPVAELTVEIDGSIIEPGVFVLPSQTTSEVKMEAKVFHKEERLYTLLMVDPDVPNESIHSFTTFVHWLIPNIPLSSTLSTISSSSAALSYLPPHPQKGSPYHRYSLLLLAQPSQASTDSDSPSVFSPIEVEGLERDGMDVRGFVQENGLECVGVNFFRQVWDEAVPEIHRTAFGTEELVYGRMPKINRFVDEQGVRPSKYDLE